MHSSRVPGLVGRDGSVVRAQVSSAGIIIARPIRILPRAAELDRALLLFAPLELVGAATPAVVVQRAPLTAEVRGFLDWLVDRVLSEMVGAA
jgi:hypothetical protein